MTYVFHIKVLFFSIGKVSGGSCPLKPKHSPRNTPQKKPQTDRQKPPHKTKNKHPNLSVKSLNYIDFILPVLG